MNASEKRAQNEASSGNQKKMRLVVETPTRGFSNCPHEVLLIIFKQLNIREVCHMARVCKRWKQAAYDEILWYHIDLGETKTVTLKRLWKLARHRCFRNVQSIKIHGSDPQLTKSQQIVSDALLTKLAEKCPRLVKLSITRANMTAISCSKLPANLTELRLERCEIPVKWFSTGAADQLTNLHSLSLDSSARIDFTHVRDLSSSPIARCLRLLSLKHCYRVDDRAVEVLAAAAAAKPCQFDSLTEIYLDGTQVTRNGVELICKAAYAHQLVRLSLVGCPKMKGVFNDEKFLSFVRESLSPGSKIDFTDS